MRNPKNILIGRIQPTPPPPPLDAPAHHEHCRNVESVHPPDVACPSFTRAHGMTSKLQHGNSRSGCEGPPSPWRPILCSSTAGWNAWKGVF